MKKVIYTLLLAVFSLAIHSCDEETGPIFQTQLPQEGIAFANAFASEYLLSEDTEDNIADRFLWSAPDFGVDTNITYEVQGSIDPTFGSFDVVGSTNETNLAIQVSQLLDFAEQLGLDDDPETTTETGLPNNSGQVYFRVRAFLGTGASASEEVISEGQPLSIVWLEQAPVGGACDSIFAVGEALTDIGWNFVPAGEVFCDMDVLSIKVALSNTGTFRFFEVSGDWGTGLNYPYFAGEGYTIDPGFEDSGDGDNNFAFVGTPGIYTITIDNVAKTIVLTPSGPLYAVGGAVPGGWGFNDDTVVLVENTPGIWSASIALTNDIFRFFQMFDVWDTNNNFAFYEDAGFTIDPDLVNDGGGDANFQFIGTPGTYTLTINEIDKTITLE
ncbi:hypothetical protein GGR42_002416 [Saonia flava]|uniref:SusE outer membrane protein domain-containing protein n=1 Tax=Saonia flava TaxID=523696 RepID=A0A846R3N1_9FLAO|nr:SusE domain-containing protein [Saonia flava]NJB71954.1 hypothetical protein [Saonia flava]